MTTSRRKSLGLRFTPAGTAMIVAVAFGLAGVVHTATLASERLPLNVIVDDAFYYITPAQNLLAGREYGLDGQTRANGVQPLWALVTLALCALSPAPSVIPHVLVLLSGVFWVAGSVLLFRALRRFNPAAALLSAVGFMLSGFSGRLAMQGMENGLHAFLCAAILLVGARNLRPRGDPVGYPAPRRFYLVLGLLLALLTLTRVESGLLALIVGLLVLSGLVRPDPRPRWRPNIPGAFWLAVPGLALVGATLVVSRAYFGSAMPISGSAKLFYQTAWGPLHGGPLGSLWWHARFLCGLTTVPLVENLQESLALVKTWTPSTRALKLGVTVVLLAGLIRLGLTQRGTGSAATGPWTWRFFSAGLIVFVLAHFATFAVAFSRFTGYGTWYFAPELMALWVAYGTLCAALFGRRRAVPSGAPPTRVPAVGLAAGLAMLWLAIAIQPIHSLADPTAARAPFLRGGRWLAERLPAGRTVGAFSAGILSYTAWPQRVVNLDGLMNDRTYFDQFLRPGRIPQYVRQRGLEYFADYASAADWRSGCFWGLNLREMQLVRWWPMSGELSYGVWQIVPAGCTPDVLDPCRGPCDRLSQIQFAADVLGRFRVVPNDQLAEVLATPAAAGLRVVTSIVEEGTGRLRHVLMAADAATALGVTPANVDLPTPLEAVFGGTIRLLGVDVPCRVAKRGGKFVFSRYWTLALGARDDAEVSFETWLHPANPGALERTPVAERLVHQSQACYETYPVHRWQTGEVVAETYAVPVPSGVPPGHYPLLLVLRDARRGWLLPDVPGACDAAPGYFVTDVEIR